MLATMGTTVFAALSRTSPDSVWTIIEPVVRYLCLVLLPPLGYIDAVKEIDTARPHTHIHTHTQL